MIQKLNLKSMELSKTEVQALKNYFNNTNINVSTLINKIGIKDWKEIQSVIDKLYKEEYEKSNSKAQ